MAKTSPDAVQILRYFETEPLEKAEVVFDIVSEKMRERLCERRDTAAKTSARGTGPSRKRRAASDRETSPEASPQQPGA